MLLQILEFFFGQPHLADYVFERPGFYFVVMRNNTSFLFLLIPPDFMGASGISSEYETCFSGLFDDFPVC